jgi:hypothetical protein
MARNGSGTYSLPESAFVYDTVIDETAVNSNFSDIASALTASIAKDGQTPPTANLPMATYRHTGVGNAVARTDYAAMGQIQDGAGIWCGTAGGTANALTLTPSPAITAYAAGQRFEFKAGASANTSTVTFAISGLSSIAGQVNGAACSGAEIEADRWYRITLSDTSTAQIEKIGAPLASAGDVSGPSSATANAMVLFDGTNGKTIKDSTYTITAAGAALLDDANAAAQRTTLGLGTAAVANTGTSAGNVVALDGSAKLPAVDGSALTNLPSSSIGTSFLAHKNGTDQTSIGTGTWTKLTLTTESWDTASSYDAANSKFIPSVAGKYRMNASAIFSAGIVDQSGYYIAFRLNGTEIARFIARASGTSPVSTSISRDVDLNGSTDYVEVFVYGEGAGDKSVYGGATETWFSGGRVV